MKIPIFVALILLYAAASAAANVFHIYLPGLLLSLTLAIGGLMEPVRVYQAVSGKFYDRLDAPEDKLKRAMRWFYAAFPFWLGLAWAAWNIGVVKSCSGDNCLGYALLALPFPFLYVAGEFPCSEQTISEMGTMKQASVTIFKPSAGPQHIIGLPGLTHWSRGRLHGPALRTGQMGAHYRGR